MKKILIIVLVIITLFAVGCNKKSDDIEKTPVNRETQRPITQSTPIATQLPEQPDEQKAPEMPAILGAEENQEPMIKVFIVEEDRVEEMKFEEYIGAVVNGEIKSEWPSASLEAQAILARSFVLKKLSEEEDTGKSYHISTDIQEAQALELTNVEQPIKDAVEATRGIVMASEGDFASAWFHSNSGGITADAIEGLDYEKDNPKYIHSVESPDGDFEEIPEDERNWTVTLTKQELLTALAEIAPELKDFSNITLGEKGDSGRTTTIIFDETSVSAPVLRNATDSTEFKSCLIDEFVYSDGSLTITGRGYGHGVGMSQWGAYVLAQEGKSYEEILNHYFQEVYFVPVFD